LLLAFRRRTLCLALAAWSAMAPSAFAADSPGYDPVRTVVGIRTLVGAEARSARTLGTERDGSGVLIGENGLILTIGYLLLEAHTVEVTTHDSRKTPAAIVAYDYETGFGLVRALRAPDALPARLGSSKDLAAGGKTLVLSRVEGKPQGTPALVVARRTFAGYWEYLLESAIFTAPPHLLFGGAGLFAEDGGLVGIGSLFVNDAAEPQVFSPGNMFVPIDDLKPILADLIAKGGRVGPPRPWMGLYSTEVEGRVVVTRVSDESPAKKAGLAPGDLIIGVGGEKVADLADFYRRAWAQGTAGADIPLDIVRHATIAADREPKIERVIVHSIDRIRWLKVDKGL